MSSEKVDLQVVKLLSTGELVVGFDQVPSPITGKNLIVQKIIKHLWTKKHSDGYNSQIGNRFFDLIGGNYRKNQGQELTSILQTSLLEAERAIKDEQRGDIEIPDSQKLDRLEIESVNFNNETASWEISVLLYTIDNRLAYFRI